MDAADYLSRSSRNLRSSVETFTDEVEGELEKYSVCGVHLTRKVTVPVCAFLVIAAIVVGVTIGTKSSPSNDASTDSTDEVYTDDHRYWSLGETIESSVGPEIYNDGTSENRALHWLAEEDPFQLPVTSTMEDVLERFLLTNLYFATNGPEWTNQYNFLSAKDVCEWNDGGGGGTDHYGVFCQEGKVYQINFNQNGLSGTIPEDIGLLSNTREFRIEDNAIVGAIPKSFGLMRELIGLNLNKNKIHGVFPQTLAAMKKLEVLKVSNNQIEGFDGIGIWKQLPNLQVVHVNNNNIKGFVGDWGDIPNLQELDCSNNQITGTIPSDFGVDQQLHHVNFGHNQIKGPIPPEFFSELSTVELLNLSDNALTGTVPTTIANMEVLEMLYLNDNPGLNGNIPVEISSMLKLESLDISATQIVGDMEAALCDNGKSWETLRTDCLDDGTASSCATVCCRQDGHCCDMTGQTACEVPPAP